MPFHDRNTLLEMMEMRNILLEGGVKAILVMKCQRSWLKCALLFRDGNRTYK